MPSPQSANEMKAAIAAAARSDDSHRIVQQRPQRRAGFAGGEGVEGQADAMVLCSRWGMEVISDAHRFSIGHWCGRWDSNPHDVAIEGF